MTSRRCRQAGQVGAVPRPAGARPAPGGARWLCRREDCARSSVISAVQAWVPSSSYSGVSTNGTLSGSPEGAEHPSTPLRCTALAQDASAPLSAAPTPTGAMAGVPVRWPTAQAGEISPRRRGVRKPVAAVRQQPHGRCPGWAGAQSRRMRQRRPSRMLRPRPAGPPWRRRTPAFAVPMPSAMTSVPDGQGRAVRRAHQQRARMARSETLTVAPHPHGAIVPPKPRQRGRERVHRREDARHDRTDAEERRPVGRQPGGQCDEAAERGEVDGRQQPRLDGAGGDEQALLRGAGREELLAPRACQRARLLAVRALPYGLEIPGIAPDEEVERRPGHEQHEPADMHDGSPSVVSDGQHQRAQPGARLPTPAYVPRRACWRCGNQ